MHSYPPGFIAHSFPTDLPWNPFGAHHVPLPSTLPFQCSYQIAWSHEPVPLSTRGVHCALPSMNMDPLADSTTRGNNERDPATVQPASPTLFGFPLPSTSGNVLR